MVFKRDRKGVDSSVRTWKVFGPSKESTLNLKFCVGEPYYKYDLNSSFLGIVELW